MQSPPVAELGRIELWASVYGNIAVKLTPIRLLALCTAASRQDSGHYQPYLELASARLRVLRRTTGRLTAFKRGRIPRLRAAARQGKSDYGCTASLLREMQARCET
jgi:hypothetical protein